MRSSWLAFTLFAASAVSADPAARLAELAPPIDQDVPYVEEVYTPALRNPVVHTGALAITPTNTLLMRVETPREELRELTQTHFKVTMTNHSGREKVRRLKLRPNRKSHTTLLAMYALLTQDVPWLAARFDMEEAGDADAWVVTLSPKPDQALASSVLSIRLTGKERQLLSMRTELADQSWREIRLEQP